MKKIIGFIGGDERSLILSNIFREKGYLVKTYALRGEDDCESIEEFLERVDYVIGGIPLSRDGEIINAPLTDDKITCSYLFSLIRSSIPVFAGSINYKVKKTAESFDVTLNDFLEDEALAISNAVPTAEGAIDVALRYMKTTLNSSNALVIGYGRIGEVLCDLLCGLHANVFVTARSETDFAWIKSKNYNSVKYEDLDNCLVSFDVIFNTVPSVILDYERLKLLKKVCIIIDLASKPGGVDFEKAKELGLYCNWALGLPGKIAPTSAALYIAASLESKL